MGKPKLTKTQVSSLTKHIAFLVIQRVAAYKHFSGKHLMILIKDLTDNPTIQKSAYHQCRRALIKLGYIGPESN